MFTAIYATSRNLVFGNTSPPYIPWHAPADLEHFKNTTSNAVVVMGRNTWETLPKKYQPLPTRFNIIVSTSMQNIDNENVAICPSLISALQRAHVHPHSKNGIFLIGGKQLLMEAFRLKLVQNVIWSVINVDVTGDIFFIPRAGYYAGSVDCIDWRKRQIDNITIQEWTVRNREEQAFIDLVKLIATTGNLQTDRTGVGTRSLFGEQLKFCMRNGKFPLLTYRRQALSQIFAELLWMLSGSTDANALARNGCSVWLNNSSREFLDSRNLQHLSPGDIGAGYGWQYRHFGAPYAGCCVNANTDANTPVTPAGFDQLQAVIDELRINPTTRRAVISIWNPAQLAEMALPPCLCMFQFYGHIENNQTFLSLKLTQRSSDILLAGGWNIATGALFLRLMCSLLGYLPDQLIWRIGDSHIYTNQLQLVDELCSRPLYQFPILQIAPHNYDNITDFQWSDLSLIGYQAGKNVKIEFNV